MAIPGPENDRTQEKIMNNQNNNTIIRHSCMPANPHGPRNTARKDMHPCETCVAEDCINSVPQPEIPLPKETPSVAEYQRNAIARWDAENATAIKWYDDIAAKRNAISQLELEIAERNKMIAQLNLEIDHKNMMISQRGKVK
jgi:hypothetical protein